MKLITLKSHLQEDCIMRKSVLMKKNKARPNFDIVHKWNKIFKVKKKKKFVHQDFEEKFFAPHFRLVLTKMFPINRKTPNRDFNYHENKNHRVSRLLKIDRIFRFASSGRETINENIVGKNSCCRSD